MKRGYFLSGTLKGIFTVLSLAGGVFFSAQLHAQTANAIAAEKKVDYLERIYFSGENKEGLQTKILIALQEIQGKEPTSSLAKQLSFLSDMRNRVESAESACDVLDLLAVGIYNIDAAEAEKQGVKQPTDKARAKSFDALASLNKLNSVTNGVGNRAQKLAWSDWMANGGTSGALGSGASKLAGTVGQVGAIGNTIGEAGQSLKELSDLSKSLGLFKKKDKPCKEVTPKQIEIGEHAPLVQSASLNTTEANGAKANQPAAVAVVTTVISIKGVSSSSLRILTDNLKGHEGVQSAEKSYNETTSTITIKHTGSTDSLADWIDDKFSGSYKLLNYETGKINLAAKPAK